MFANFPIEENAINFYYNKQTKSVAFVLSNEL